MPETFEHGPGENPLSGGDRSLSHVSPDLRATAVGGPLGGYPNETHEHGGEHLSSTIHHYVRIAIKRKWLIAGLTTLITILGALNVFMKTPLYIAGARIQIDLAPMEIVKGGELLAPTDKRDFQTQIVRLKSRDIAERVVAALQLHENEKFLNAKRTSIIGFVFSVFGSHREAKKSPTAAHRIRATYKVLDGVSIRPVKRTRLVDIQFKGPDPELAKQIANAYAAAYVASNLDKRFEANAFAKTFLEDQIKQLKIRLGESEKQLLAFAEKEQIVKVSKEASVAENNLAAANSALGELVSQRIRNEQLWRQVQNAKGINLPQLLTNSVIDRLRGQRQALTREYKEKSEIFKPGYPEMQRIANKIKEIDRLINSEFQTVRESLKAAYEASANQEQIMRKRIDTLRADVLDLQKRAVEYNILKREVDTNRDQYDSLLKRLKEVGIAGGVGANNVFVINEAGTPGSPSEPRIGRAIILALLLGLGGSCAAAYLLELLDERLVTPEEIEAVSGLPTLGIIPDSGEKEAFQQALTEPSSTVAEAYRSLATALQFTTEKGLPRSISVTSSGPSEGKSSTSIALALHFARLGMKVLLVDSDLRKPSLHIKLDLDNSVGLSNYLTGTVSPPDAMQGTHVPNLAFMSAGPPPPNAADLLGGPQMYSLVSVGLEIFDLILIDGPPIVGLADAQLLASVTSATIFVVSSGTQTKRTLRGTLARLELARTRPLGVIVTKFNAKTAGYGYGYAYGYGYGLDDGYSGSSQPEEQHRRPRREQLEMIDGD